MLAQRVGVPGTGGGPSLWLLIPGGQAWSPDRMGVLRSSTTLAPGGHSIMPVKLGNLAENGHTLLCGVQNEGQEGQ